MTNKLNTILFLSLLFGIPLLYFILPKQKISVDEKRKLAIVPDLNYESYIKGAWADSMDSYVDDHFPFRTAMINMAVELQSWKGIHLKEQEKVFVSQKPKVNKNKDEKDSTESELNFLDEFEQAYSGSMLIINGSVYPMGGGSPAMSKHFSKMVSEYAEQLKGECRVFSAVAPLSSAFIPVEKYKQYNSQNKKTLKAIGSSLTNGAIFCDVFEEMNKHAGEKMYFSTDHHWKPIGAYYAYVAFCKAAGFEPVPLNKMDKRTKYNFLGSLYQHTLDPSVKNNPDTMEYYIPKVTTTAVRYTAYGYDKQSKSQVFAHSSSGGNTYSTFISGDSPMMRINTNVKNGKKAIVIKNSYGNAFVVYLISHYEEIWVVDFRYSKQNIIETIRKNKINDMIFAMGMYGAMSKGTINMMRNLGKQSGIYVPPKPKITDPQDSTTITPIPAPTDTTTSN
jgi:hypothetical protein